ncbi:MAG TPA: hypothetical protein VKQ36_13480, partial [Ktedonobacterales bacterium]|nr:hypothetical protein [Ktedonobacterales bacterium]
MSADDFVSPAVTPGLPDIAPDAAVAPATKSTAVAPPPPRTFLERAQEWVSSSFATAVVIIIALLWLTPTVGVFVTSFRSHSDIQNSGWWTGLLPPWHFTVQNYVNVISSSGNGNGMGAAFVNSLIISIPGTIIPTIVAA